MLTNIHIQDFTIISELELDLKPGFTALTGETGAGKSIMVDAIELALGRRADTQIIRHQKDRASISLTFDISNIPHIKTSLEKYDLEVNDACVIRRVIYRDGRSKSYINDTPVTLPILREVGESLINIQGQHESQTLLQQHTQKELLDSFGKHDALNKKIENLCHDWKITSKEYETLQSQSLEAKTQIEFITFQLNELNELNLKESELETLEKEHQQLSNAHSLLSNSEAALNILSENENTNIHHLLEIILSHLNSIENLDTGLANAADLVRQAQIYIDEASHDIHNFLNHVDLNPERLEWIENRLNKTYALAKKHHTSPDQLIDLQQQIALKLSMLEHSDETLQTLKLKIKSIEEEYLTYAKKLSFSRKKAAAQLEKQVSKYIQTLGMPHGEFKINLSLTDSQLPHTAGLEKITFLIAINPGHPFQPLSKVASGGELSRISLAIQAITAKYHATPTLIFDEVDIGIGGATAEIVGKLLRELAQSTQVLCITHLAQVAAQAQQHFKVEKQIAKDNTLATVTALEDKERIQEIARMIGGIKITPQTLAHAKEMLNL